MTFQSEMNEGESTMKKMLIFDMDGVIIDSEPLHERARQILYKKYNVTVNDRLPDPVGKSCSGFWKTVLEMQNIKGDPYEMQEEQYGLVAELIRREHIPANDGVIELLAWCRQKGVRIGLASSSTRSLVNSVLELLHLSEYFDCTVSGDEIARKKPAPDVYQKVLALAKLRSEEAAAIEDSASGIAAAKSAGLYCYGYQNVTSGEQDLSNADMIVKSFAEIWKEERNRT